MSSMRNAVQRRNHKERSQPQERSKWGLLEKRKDYSLRAKDHNLKKQKLKALQQKAAERNEDEFYFGMMRSQTRGGRKIAVRGEENSGGSGKSLSMDVVKLMKTQDTAYLRTVLQSTKRTRERVEQELVMLETGASLQPAFNRTKVTFDEAEAQNTGLNTTSEKDVLDLDLDLDALLALEENRVQSDDSAAESEDERITPQEKAKRRKKRHNIDVKRRQLEALRVREQSLTTALREVEDQRARMNGTAGGVNKAGVKFKARERRR